MRPVALLPAGLLPEDACYHRRCDRIGQIGRRTLDDLSRAAAAAVGAALDPRKVPR